MYVRNPGPCTVHYFDDQYLTTARTLQRDIITRVVVGLCIRASWANASEPVSNLFYDVNTAWGVNELLRWMLLFFSCTVASVQKRHVAIARLRHPAYLGRTCQEVWFIILVVTSTKEVAFQSFLITLCCFFHPTRACKSISDGQLYAIGRENEWQKRTKMHENKMFKKMRKHLVFSQNSPWFIGWIYADMRTS